MPKNSVKLRKMLSEIMIRHRRADTLIKFPQRYVHTHSIDLNRMKQNSIVNLLILSANAILPCRLTRIRVV
jgi:hypothetical protein